MILVWATYFCLGYTKLFQDDAQWAKIGEARLKQIDTDKSSEGQRPFTDKQRAAFHAQRQRNHDEKAGKNNNVTLNGHGRTPVKFEKWEDLWFGFVCQTHDTQ